MDIIFPIKGCPFLCAMHIFCSVHDAALRGQNLRPNQGIAFTLVGFRSWKKQHGSVLQHEACTSHTNSIVAQVKPHFYSKGQSSILICLWKERSCLPYHMKPLYNRLLKAQQSCLELCFEIQQARTNTLFIRCVLGERL